MKALVYRGPGKQSWEEKPKPTVQEPTDAIVKISKTTICGTDLHIMKGDVPTVTDGRILGIGGFCKYTCVCSLEARDTWSHQKCRA